MGSASGLVERFVREGMKVVCADVDAVGVEAEVTRLREAGAEVLAAPCDVREASALEALRDRTLSHFGGVHVVVNNAGVAPAGPMLETNAADWRWIVDVNLLGVAYGVSVFGPVLRDAGEGHIVNTASEAGLVSSAVLGMYTATKHAVVGLSESLYRELGGTGVGVHCLCPNLVRTKIFESERNRDDGAAMRVTETATLAPLREAITALGISVDDVAGDVLDAMRNDRFWIFTHPTTPQSAAVRFADIEARRNPTDPYAGIAGSDELGELS